MAKEKSNIELKRVNINLPSALVDKVRDYADSLGINTTSAYVVLLNQALNTNQQVQNMPLLISMYQEIMANPEFQKLLSNKETDK